MCYGISGAQGTHTALCQSSVQVRTSPYSLARPLCLAQCALPVFRRLESPSGRQPTVPGRHVCHRVVGCRAYSLPILLILAKYVLKIHQCYRAYAQLSPNANSSLHFPSAHPHFQNRCPAFSFLREAQNEKANIKSFGKGWRGFRLR